MSENQEVRARERTDPGKRHGNRSQRKTRLALWTAEGEDGGCGLAGGGEDAGLTTLSARGRDHPLGTGTGPVPGAALGDADPDPRVICRWGIRRHLGKSPHEEKELEG